MGKLKHQRLAGNTLLKLPCYTSCSLHPSVFLSLITGFYNIVISVRRECQDCTLEQVPLFIPHRVKLNILVVYLISELWKWQKNSSWRAYRRLPTWSFKLFLQNIIVSRNMLLLLFSAALYTIAVQKHLNYHALPGIEHGAMPYPSPPIFTPSFTK